MDNKSFTVVLSDGTIAVGSPSELWGAGLYSALVGGDVQKAIAEGRLTEAGEIAQVHLEDLALEKLPFAKTEVAELLEKGDEEFLAEIEAELTGLAIAEPLEEVGEGKRKSRKKPATGDAERRSMAIETLINRKAKMAAFEDVVRRLIGRCLTGEGSESLRQDVLAALCNVYGDTLPPSQYSKKDDRFCPATLADLVNLLVQAIAQGLASEAIAKQEKALVG